MMGWCYPLARSSHNLNTNSYNHIFLCSPATRERPEHAGAQRHPRWGSLGYELPREEMMEDIIGYVGFAVASLLAVALFGGLFGALSESSSWQESLGIVATWVVIVCAVAAGIILLLTRCGEERSASPVREESPTPLASGEFTPGPTCPPLSACSLNLAGAEYVEQAELKPIAVLASTGRRSGTSRRCWNTIRVTLTEMLSGMYWRSCRSWIRNDPNDLQLRREPMCLIAGACMIHHQRCTPVLPPQPLKIHWYDLALVVCSSFLIYGNRYGHRGAPTEHVRTDLQSPAQALGIGSHVAETATTVFVLV